MNKKQENYLLYKLAQSLSLNNPLKYEEIHHMITSEYEDLSDDEMTDKRFEVYDGGFSKHIEDTYYTEDKHEHNLYDIWEMCRKLNELNDKCQVLEIENKSLEHGATKYAELYHESLKENKELKQFKQKTFDLINRKINEYEEDYNHAVKSGMPSNSTYENIELLEYLKGELEK